MNNKDPNSSRELNDLPERIQVALELNSEDTTFQCSPSVAERRDVMSSLSCSEPLHMTANSRLLMACKDE